MSLYTKSPAAWLRRLLAQRRQAYEGTIRAIDTGNELARKIYEKEIVDIDRAIVLEKSYLADSIKLLRKYVNGFEAASGYDLHRIAHLIPAREEKVRRYARQIRQEIASPHIEIVPRTAEALRAVKQHTGQSTIPNRKRFIIHTNKPETTKARVVYKTVIVRNAKGRKRKVKTASLEIDQTVKGGQVQDRYFYFPESPKSFNHIIKMTRKMLKSMPKGYYTLQSANHGTIGRSIPSELLLEELQDRYVRYDVFDLQNDKDDRGLAETITGFKLISFTVTGADREYKERLSTRLQMQKYQRAQRAQHQRDVLAKKGLYQCKVCNRVFAKKETLKRHLKNHR
jgi:hypothetical protein